MKPKKYRLYATFDNHFLTSLIALDKDLIRDCLSLVCCTRNSGVSTQTQITQQNTDVTLASLS